MECEYCGYNLDDILTERNLGQILVCPNCATSFSFDYDIENDQIFVEF